MWRLALQLAVALVLARCGRARDVDEPAASGSTRTGTRAPMTQQLEIRRTGGVAGFDDKLTIAPDGAAALTTRGGRRRSCQLPAPLLDRARSIRWDALPSAPQPTGRSDVMRFVVTSGGGTTTLDADVPPAEQAAAVQVAATSSRPSRPVPPRLEGPPRRGPQLTGSGSSVLKPRSRGQGGNRNARRCGVRSFEEKRQT